MRWWRQRICWCPFKRPILPSRDRKSTRLNSSHGYISYAVFCLKKKITVGCLLLGCFVRIFFIGPSSCLCAVLCSFTFLPSLCLMPCSVMAFLCYICRTYLTGA